MQEINQIVNGFKTKIFVGAKINLLYELTNPENSLIITDTNVFQIYRNEIKDFPIVTIPAGERSKNLDLINGIYKKMLDLKFDRDSMVIGFGGGVVCDIAGFVASTYKRGINLGLVPTTLLAQIDASIGGKNAVNLNGYKNIIGTFKQARFILSDISVLKTLPKKEMYNAYSELIKTALISDRNFFDEIINNKNKLLEFDYNILENIIFRCAKIKSEIVVKDETESNLRRILNFGHTFGHAIESSKKIAHGEAVSIGMVLALQLSKKILNLPSDLINNVRGLLGSLKLPTTIDFDKQEVLRMIGNDKKNYNNKIKFVLLQQIGEPIVKDIDLKYLESFINDLP